MKSTEAPLDTGNSILPEQEKGKGWHSRGYLPHFDASGLYQAITYRLGDSLPRSASIPPASSPPGDDEKKERRQTEQKLDKGYGSCILRDKGIAKIVVDAWKYFDARRYDLVAYVVMPNHVHVLIKTHEGFPLSDVVHSWKSFTAHEINKHLKGLEICGRDARGPGDKHLKGLEICGRDARGPGDKRLRGGGDTKVWQEDYFDRFIRDERHFAQAIAYIHENPVKAGLCRHASEWPWSSANEDRERQRK